MTHKDFLSGFAQIFNIPSVEVLLNQYSEKYSFQINSRERVKAAVNKLLSEYTQLNFEGLRILDVGCAYGAFTIEVAKSGAKAVGMDLNLEWLNLAKENAKDEVVDTTFIQCDAASYRACEVLMPYGPFDVVFVNDVFEHIYDTVGLLKNLSSLISLNGILYFKVPNGQATKHVLLEGHKKVFGISLLAPDYWSHFVETPFHIYYRRWEYFTSLFQEHQFHSLKILNKNHDESHDLTKKHILRDVHKIKEYLKLENFKNREQFKFLKDACNYYFEEVHRDIDNMPWNDLFFKYRVSFWEGIILGPALKSKINEYKTIGL